jgi:hypothetical protein
LPLTRVGSLNDWRQSGMQLIQCLPIIADPWLYSIISYFARQCNLR